MWPFNKRENVEPDTRINYILVPKEDITAYELALLVKARGWNDLLQGLPKEAKRHLIEVVIDNKTGMEIHKRELV